jgi:hypothetical protein
MYQAKKKCQVQQHTLVNICRSLYVDAYDCGMYVPPLVVIPFPSDMVEAMVLLAKAPIVFPNVPEVERESKVGIALETTKEITKDNKFKGNKYLKRTNQTLKEHNTHSQKKYPNCLLTY